jgi:pimeloyl-ACP methyl ester carboxylesterase
MPEDGVQLKDQDPGLQPALIYLPGLHGDWTLAAPLGRCLAGQSRFVTVTYPRTVRWSITDYSTAVQRALGEQGIERGWVLAESFGSQVAWPLFDPSQPSPGFRPDGLILAGGFVRHPWPAAARGCARLLAATPPSVFRVAPNAYRVYAHLRSADLSHTREALREFVERRTSADLRAMVHRLHLLADNDPRPLARRITTPVYHLVGLFDPIVPALPVRRWLRKHCPGFRQGRTLWSADHNVLLITARAAAQQILAWIPTP